MIKMEAILNMRLFTYVIVLRLQHIHFDVNLKILIQHVIEQTPPRYGDKITFINYFILYHE